MLRKWLKNHLPDKKAISSHSSMGRLGSFLSRHPSLWYFNRYSIARGVAVGLFVAFIPLPMQMLIAAFLSIIFRANVPIAVVMTWVSNPLTFVPFNYAIYFIGTWVLGENIKSLAPHEVIWNFDSLYTTGASFISWLSHFGRAYFIGLPFVAIGCSVIGYFGVMMLWRLSRYVKSQKN